MNIALIARATLHQVPGGDTIQVMQTARQLQRLGINAEVKLTHEKINYHAYHAFHFFNLVRPADILRHLPRVQQPIFITPILVDYSEFDRHHRKGFSGQLIRMLPAAKREYIKTLGRGMMARDRFPPAKYLLQGQAGSILRVLQRANTILPNSEGEMRELEKKFGKTKDYHVVPNGIDPSVFRKEYRERRAESGAPNRNVICVARIEGLKNQLNLIRALNNTEFTLTLIGRASSSHGGYYKECRRNAAGNIRFIDHLPQEELVEHYLRADIHVLPSWFETCGLSSLEAAAMGCRIVITDKGFAREYFGDEAVYCDPGDPASILDSVRRAATQPPETIQLLHQRIYDRYTWPLAARITLSCYEKYVQ